MLNDTSVYTVVQFFVVLEGRKEMFYLMTYSTHFNGYIAYGKIQFD